MAVQDFAHVRSVTLTEEYVPTLAASQPGPQWYITKMRDLYEYDPQLLDPSQRVYFPAESAPPQLRAKRPDVPEGAPSTLGPVLVSLVKAVVPVDLVVLISVTPPTLDIEDDVPEAVATKYVYVVFVTCSDLPPAPPAAVAEITSPYTRQQHGRAAFALFQDASSHDKFHILKSAARATVKHMEASLSTPTVTSQRQIPAKPLIENRALTNAHLACTAGGKVSFTHLISYAPMEALYEMPDLNVHYTIEGDKPVVEQLVHIGLGLAIDVANAQGNRSLRASVIHDADALTFAEFVDAYQGPVARARTAMSTTTDFQSASVTSTNPSMLGTTTSVSRLTVSQGLIIDVGATSYPAEFRGVSPKRLAALGIGKTVFLSFAYDHHIIQGAASGRLLALVDAKLSGRDGFYERVFTSMHVPACPYAWEVGYDYDPDHEKGKPARIVELIHAYRSRSHLVADTDLLAYRVRRHPDLDLSSYGLSTWDLDRPFPIGGFGDPDQALLRDILMRLHDTYTRAISIEYMHIQDPEQHVWVQKRVERPYEAPSSDAQRHILGILICAETFEEFLQMKPMGQKRFSLKGGEPLTSLLNHILADSVCTGIHEAATGMAYRGRLNVLANIAGKLYTQIFDEFEGNYMPNPAQGPGDAKYYLGTWGVYSLDDGLATKVYMAAGPSHLEVTGGVLEGVVRAKQKHSGNPDLPITPVLIHGDATFIGQGVVQETLNLSQLEGYKTGGMIRIIVNNQIGFTAGLTQGRSIGYATDLIKGLQVPILHVNADDPEAVTRCAYLAFEYRNALYKDVIIDMVCHRCRGRNGSDDPSMTQPVMYSLIDRIPSTCAVHIRGLVGRGQLTEDEARQSIAQYETELGRILEETRVDGASSVSEINPGSRTRSLALTAGVGETGESPDEEWAMLESQMPGIGMMIGWMLVVPAKQLCRIGRVHTRFLEGFEPHPKLCQLRERRPETALDNKPIDWGFAELLAFGTLLMEGTGVYLFGEDVGRVIFVQRHAIPRDANDGREFTPLRFLTENQAHFDTWNSPLSEYGVLAFDYGYSLESPETLTIWEVQFGDLANGAQTVIGELVCSAEQKWGQRSSLAMLLPHGHEGQGPDHPSARIGHYLQLVAQESMWIVQLPTPVNYFYMLRAQAYKRPCKPFIAFTPKQLLRLSTVSSHLDEFTPGAFQLVIGDSSIINPSLVARVLPCLGRLYYDLVKEREHRGDTSTAIIYLEQLYPLPEVEVTETPAQYPNASVSWVQDEPCNQGVWPHLAPNLFPSLGRPVRAVSRPEPVTTAAGCTSLHKEQAAILVAQAFEG